MSIGDSRHGVDLEELVRADGGSSLNWAPVRERWLSIVEPLVAHVLDVVRIDLANARGNLRASQSSAKREHLGADLSIHGVRLLQLQKIVVKSVAATNNLDVVDEVRVDSGQADAAIVHLTGENFIAEEIVAEEARVGVGVVLTVANGDINEVAEQGVHGVVLLLDIVEVLGVLINSVGAKHVLKQEESKVVLILYARSIIEDTDVAIVHLIVTDHEHAGVVNIFLTVGSHSAARLADRAETSLHLLHELVVNHVASANDYNVVTEPVGGAVLLQIVDCQVGQVIGIALDWLAHHVVSERVVVAVLDRCRFEVLKVGSVLSSNLLLAELELSSIERGIGDAITKQIDYFTSVTLEAGHREMGSLTVMLAVNPGTRALNSHCELGLRVL